MSHSSLRIGVISDTHGLLRPEAVSFLQGCARIIHAGDIGNAGVLEALKEIAPVVAVRGNNDKGSWALSLPHTERFPIGARWCYLIHDLAEIDIDPHAAAVSLVVAGHTHVPKQTVRDGCLWLNPGSAGPRRFKLPVSAAEVIFEGEELRAKIVTLMRNT